MLRRQPLFAFIEASAVAAAHGLNESTRVRTEVPNPKLIGHRRPWLGCYSLASLNADPEATLGHSKLFLRASNRAGGSASHSAN